MESSGRRLAAIMFTDIVGYACLVQRDERLALELLEEHRSLIRPLITHCDGSEVKTIGDGFLIEFPSALQAVRGGGPTGPPCPCCDPAGDTDPQHPQLGSIWETSSIGRGMSWGTG